MHLSAKVQYGCLALMELAGVNRNDESHGYLAIGELASRCRVPDPYLLQVLLRLKAAGLVESRRGNTGGYRLAQTADHINLDEVVQALEGVPAAKTGAVHGRPAGLAALERGWSAAEAARRAALRGVSIAKLVDWEREAAGSGLMFHI